MFVVVGVTGHTGSAVAETLLRNRERVRVVRSAEKGISWYAKGAEVAGPRWQWPFIKMSRRWRRPSRGRGACTSYREARSDARIQPE